MKHLHSLRFGCLLCAAVLLQADGGGAQPVTKIAAGVGHSMFLKSDGSLWVMGWIQYGQLGDGTDNIFTNKLEEIVTSNVTAIAAGANFSLLLKSDGGLWGMGDNGYYQLGAEKQITTESIQQPRWTAVRV